MFWNKYPYTNFHELNLDWILHKIMGLEKTMTEWEALNKITFSGEWDITKQYPAWCIVNTGGTQGYISIKPVPAGVVITNTDYWAGVVDYTATIADLQNRVITLETKCNIIDNIINFKRIFENKKVLIVGDSISVPGTTWADTFKSVVESIGGAVDNVSVGGYSLAQAIAAVSALTESYDIALVWIGINNANNSTPLGSMLTPGTFNYQYKQLIDSLRALNNSMYIYTFGISFAKNISYVNAKAIDRYNVAIKNVSTWTGCIFKNLNKVANNSYYNTEAVYPDLVHFTESYSKGMLCNAIIGAVSDPRSDEYNALRSMSTSDITLESGFSAGVGWGYEKIGESIHLTCGLGVSASTPSGTDVFDVVDGHIPLNTVCTIVGDAGSALLIYGATGFHTTSTVPAGVYALTLDYCPGYIDQIAYT